MLLASSREDLIRETESRLAGIPAPTGKPALASEERFLRARTQLPAQLTGRSYTNMGGLAWNKISADFVRGIREGAKRQGIEIGPSPGALPQLAPAIFPRYLRVAASGWWKNADGIYFDWFIQ